MVAFMGKTRDRSRLRRRNQESFSGIRCLDRRKLLQLHLVGESGGCVPLGLRGPWPPIGKVSPRIVPPGGKCSGVRPHIVRTHPDFLEVLPQSGWGLSDSKVGKRFPADGIARNFRSCSPICDEAGFATGRSGKKRALPRRLANLDIGRRRSVRRESGFPPKGRIRSKKA